MLYSVYARDAQNAEVSQGGLLRVVLGLVNVG